MTPAASALARTEARWAFRAVKSHSATNVNWAAVESEWRMCSAILRRSPRSGMRSSSAEAGAAVPAPPDPDAPGAAGGTAAPARFTSSAVTAPPGPLPARPSSATPICFASWRTAGLAMPRPGGAAAAALAEERVPAATGAGAAAVAPPWLFQRAASGSPRSAAGASLAAGASSPPTAIEMMTLPTGTTSPSAAWSFAMTPVRGEGISTLALSVITSTSG